MQIERPKLSAVQCSSRLGSARLGSTRLSRERRRRRAKGAASDTCRGQVIAPPADAVKANELRAWPPARGSAVRASERASGQSLSEIWLKDFALTIGGERARLAPDAILAQLARRLQLQASSAGRSRS